MRADGRLPSSRRIVVGITDGPGMAYGVRLLEMLQAQGAETHVVVSEGARAGMQTETGVGLDDVGRLASQVHHPANQAARISSGSFLADGMIVAPCSVAAAGAIAHGTGSDLLARAADVTMKEGRPLVLLIADDDRSPALLEGLGRLAGVPGVRVAYPYPQESVDDTVAGLLRGFFVDATSRER